MYIHMIVKQCTIILFILHNIPFDNQGSEINKNDIFIYMRKILGLNLKVLGLHIWITLHFTGFGLKTFWTAIYNYTYQILYWRWTWKYLYYKFWITITIFHAIWTLKYLDYGLDFDCYLPYWIRTCTKNLDYDY